jgi:peptidoglycan/LPS O-acetylase OafA/YrhL
MITYASRQLRWWIPVVPSLLLSIYAEAATSTLSWGPQEIARNLVFFLIGARLPQVLKFIAARASGYQFGLLVIAFITVSIFVNPVTQSEVRPFISVIAIPAVLMGAVLATRNQVIAQAGTWLGARTLPIYLLHFPVVAALGLLTRAVFEDVLAPSALAAVLYPLVVTAASVLLSLLLHRSIRSLGCNWVFEMPRGASLHRVARARAWLSNRARARP